MGHHYQRKRGQDLRPLLSRKTKSGDGIRPLLPNPDLPGTLLVQLSRGLFAVIDESDADRVARHNWLAHIGAHSRTAYARTNLSGPEGRRGILLHRFLWDLWGMPPTPGIDHENTNGLDCRRLNLRAATTAENLRNIGIRRNNRSGFKGVSWHVQHRKWYAAIRANGHQVFLGLFDDPSVAGHAYAQAAKTFHAEFARSA